MMVIFIRGNRKKVYLFTICIFILFRGILFYYYCPDSTCLGKVNSKELHERYSTKTIPDTGPTEPKVLEEKMVARFFEPKNAMHSIKSNSLNKISNSAFHAGLYVPVCMILISGECKNFPHLPYYGWFHDDKQGGPTASSQIACKTRKNKWQNYCKDGKVEMFFNSLWPKDQLVVSSIEAICKFQISGSCKNFPALSNADWFRDEDKGGPKATTLFRCQVRKKDWENDCQAVVKMDFSGPGKLLPMVQGNSSWTFQDIDGAMITLTPRNDISTANQYKSCFDMLRTPKLPAVSYVHFCYPTLNIYGHPKAGTSALYHILQKHPNIKTAHFKKEYCISQPHYEDSYFRYFYGFAKATKKLGANDVLVNGCIVPYVGMELDNLLRGPKALSIYLVRDAGDRAWATYNYWCDWNLEPECTFGGRVKKGIHIRSPELFNQEVMDGALHPKKMLIPDYKEIATLYTRNIHMFETMTVSKQIYVIASEKMKINLPEVWKGLSEELNGTLGYDIPMHPKIDQLSNKRVNVNSNKAMIMPETSELLSSWWDECEELSARTAWPYRCYPKNGYKISKLFQPMVSQSLIRDIYITLWLHQVHSWFSKDAYQSTADKVKKFLLEAKNSGFTQIMFDLAWAWTEREFRGDVQIDTWNKKDVMCTACSLGLSLHVVISMRELPPWAKKKKFFEIGSYGEGCKSKYRQTTGPSTAHPEVWQMAKEYVESATKLLVERYGECIISVSPTFSNEFETRYTQTFGLMRDYSNFSVAAYKSWQVEKGLAPSNEESIDPPGFPCTSNCYPIIEQAALQWLAFREDFLASRYIELCEIVKRNRSVGQDYKLYIPNCLLHFGEMFSSTDAINSNLFFTLAKSEFVDHLVMDSNMALFGAPTSPSIVGVLVSTAHAYGKSVHYEAATERILPCDVNGQLDKNYQNFGGETGVPLLFRSGISRALEAGVHGIGVTNLCIPSAIKSFLSPQGNKNNEDGDHALKRASSFKPTAVIFVPYQAFYAWSFVLSGVNCGMEHKACWHHSFDRIPTFGRGKLSRQRGMCVTDVAQHALTRAWDDLRTRHAQVAVISDPLKLTDNLLKATTERVFLRFPCIMSNDTWHFFKGNTLLEFFKEKSNAFLFSEVYVSMPGPGTCPPGLFSRANH